jgi:ATP-dependent Zn protease
MYCALNVVYRYGMSNIGPIALEDDNNEQMFMGGESNEIHSTLSQCLEKFMEIIILRTNY